MCIKHQRAQKRNAREVSLRVSKVSKHLFPAVERAVEEALLSNCFAKNLSKRLCESQRVCVKETTRNTDGSSERLKASGTRGEVRYSTPVLRTVGIPGVYTIPSATLRQG